MKSALLLTLAAALTACAAPRPKFYPNERYPSVGEEQAKKDTDECLGKAKEYLKENPLKPVARKTAWGAASGAVIGAVVGAITGDFKGALESGAAAGGAAGVMQGTADANTPDGVVRAYTDRCLAEKGYSVLGWR
ncbi:MAG: cell envelope biogenesis protein OmpA [Elusimicrobiota bacterium]